MWGAAESGTGVGDCAASGRPRDETAVCSDHQPVAANATASNKADAKIRGQRRLCSGERNTGIAVSNSGARPSRRSASDLRKASRISDTGTPPKLRR